MKKVLSLLVCVVMIISLAVSATAVSKISVKSIKLNKSKITLEVRQTYNLKVAFTPANTTQKLLTYSTSNKNIATVDKSGKIAAISTGTVIITVVSYSNKKILQKCTVTVSKATKYNGIDISKEVKITGYLIGAAPVGMPAVMTELNKRFKRDINATMEINYIGWGDLNSKYPLILASGEDIDWIFTASWANYTQEAAKGAFYQYSEATLKKYMPKQYAALEKFAYKETSVNGKMYMIPSSYRAANVHVVAIRGDLRKKYGISAVSKLSDLEPFLAAIKKNEPAIIPVNCDNSFDVGQIFDQLAAEKGMKIMDILSSLSGSGSGVECQMEDKIGKLYTIDEEPVATQFKYAANIMKSWYDKGYINKDYFSNKTTSSDSLKQGKSAVGISNSIAIQNVMAGAKANGYEIEVIPMIDSLGKSQASPYINNGVALAARTKNPERTMMALDLIMQDESYNYLAYFGIEGKNYVVKNGKMDLPAGVTVDNNTYAPDAAGFWFTNEDQFKPYAYWDANYIQLRKDSKEKYCINAPITTFSPDIANVKTEIANLNDIFTQFFVPLKMGSVQDVNASYNNLVDKLNLAGVKKVKDELQKQLTAYMKTMAD